MQVASQKEKLTVSGIKDTLVQANPMQIDVGKAININGVEYRQQYKGQEKFGKQIYDVHVYQPTVSYQVGKNADGTAKVEAPMLSIPLKQMVRKSKSGSKTISYKIVMDRVHLSTNEMDIKRGYIFRD